ncbi:MAG TPA: TRAP transporter substrate-binding protein DctP [Casimicrobiaceae bacterium]|nr:TRAP transporter substrate-binding protein DctP [Casimicrobiaceae bacterium]
MKLWSSAANRWSRGAGIATALVATLALPACGQPRPVEPAGEIKLSTGLGPAYAQGRAGEVWAALIRERSAGRIAVKHYPGAMLAQREPAREFPALRDGAIDLAVGSSLAWSAQVPALNLLALPWLVPDDSVLETLLAGDTGKRLSASVDAAGVVPLLLSANGLSALATKEAIHKPSDLGGLKIRVAASPIAADMLSALGAGSSSMGLADARAAWASGALDGQETSVATYVNSRMDSVGLTHLLLWQARADALIFAVNRARWEGWSEADRELVRSAAQEAARQARALAQQSDDSGTAARQGAVVSRLTPQGKAAFRAAAASVYVTWTPVIGEDLVRDAQTEIAAAQGTR